MRIINMKTTHTWQHHVKLFSYTLYISGIEGIRYYIQSVGGGKGGRGYGAAATSDLKVLYKILIFIIQIFSWQPMDLIPYSLAPLILFLVPYTLDLLPYYLSIANGAGGVGIFELFIFLCFV